jgi:hypothetical protein
MSSVGQLSSISFLLFGSGVLLPTLLRGPSIFAEIAVWDRGRTKKVTGRHRTEATFEDQTGSGFD